jgi:hypothetical protein
MTCHAIYRQKARTKSKDIGGSDRLTAFCVCQSVKTENFNTDLLCFDCTSQKKHNFDLDINEQFTSPVFRFGISCAFSFFRFSAYTT